jgi:hypothetical protein
MIPKDLQFAMDSMTLEELEEMKEYVEALIEERESEEEPEDDDDEE